MDGPSRRKPARTRLAQRRGGWEGGNPCVGAAAVRPAIYSCLACHGRHAALPPLFEPPRAMLRALDASIRSKMGRISQGAQGGRQRGGRASRRKARLKN